VASFGGALHEPVTSFFMVALGASTAQMGTFGAIRTLGTWVLSPVYGWVIDKHSAFLPTLFSAFVCALGCTLRGLAPVGRIDLLYAAAVVLGLGAANFWNVVQAYLASATEPELRHKVLSAYYVQVTTLQLLGKSCYPLWDGSLKAAGLAAEQLVRFRISMSVCSVFCIFGVFNLIINGQSMKEVTKKSASESEDSKVSDQKMVVGSHVSFWEVITFAAIAAVLAVHSAAQIVVGQLWPLYVQRQFAWADHSYAWLSLISSIVAIFSASMLPALAHHVGAGPVATVLCASAAMALLLGFPAKALLSAHVFGSLTFIGCSAALKPCLEALASLSMPVHFQGRSFALLKLAVALGDLLGNYFGMRLFDVHTGDVAASPAEWSYWLPRLDGGALPFVVAGIALFLSTTILSVALLPQYRLAVLRAATSSNAANTAMGNDKGSTELQTAAAADQELDSLLRQRIEASRCVHSE